MNLNECLNGDPYGLHISRSNSLIVLPKVFNTKFHVPLIYTPRCKQDRCMFESIRTSLQAMFALFVIHLEFGLTKTLSVPEYLLRATPCIAAII